MFGQSAIEVLTKTCNLCMFPKILTDFHSDPRRSFGVRKECKDCGKEAVKNIRYAYKHKAIFVLGGSCNKCHEKEFEFLTIDLGNGVCVHKREEK